MTNFLFVSTLIVVKMKFTVKISLKLYFQLLIQELDLAAFIYLPLLNLKYQVLTCDEAYREDLSEIRKELYY